ncbi:MAG: trigger factor [Ignavibacteriae bacterium]|nr:trigger factor [Ignavibacteriota bacterium]
MDVTINDISNIVKELQVTLSLEELQPHFEKAYKREQAKIEIKGFRKGKAPLEIVKRIYGESIEYDALDDIANDVFKQILTERNIFPLGEVSMTDMKFKRGEPFSFTIKYEVQPDFELKEYKGIAVDKFVHTVDEDELEDEIERLRKANSTLTEVQKAEDDEHVVTVDIQELDDSGSPLIGKKSSGGRIYLADENIFHEVRYTLQNISVNESRRVSFEVEHGDHKHLNNWELTATKIEKVNVPELTDEFAKKATRLKVDTVEQFREHVKKDLEAYWAETTDRYMKEALVGEIVKQHDMEIPQAMITGLTDAKIEELKEQSPGKKMPDDFDEKKFRESYKPIATYSAKWFLIRDKIVAKEQLTLTDAELEVMAEEDAPKMSISKERLLAFYKTSDSLKDKMVNDKLMNFLVSHAVVTEKVHEESNELVS